MYSIPRRKVLLLEDDPTYQEAIKDYLEADYFDVEVVSNGVDGLRRIKEHSFDAVVCDLMMPSVPGDMFYLAVQRLRPALCRCFVFITGHRDDDRIDGFLKKVNRATLWKPFHMTDLREALTDVINDPHGKVKKVYGQKHWELLFIEDDPEVRTVVGSYLEENFFKTTMAGNGQEGLELIIERDFDVILSDIRMPGMGGEEFYMGLVHLKPELCNHVVFLSAFADDREIEEFVQSTGCPMLHKPVQLSDLRQTLKQVASSRFIPRKTATEHRAVLLIEDDVALQEVMAEYLKGLGLEVRVVLDGIRGLEEIQANDYDAIICDMMMPGMSGQELYEAVNQTMPATCARFVFITGNRTDPNVEEFLSATGRPVLVKPFKLEELERGVVQVSGSPHA